MSKLIPFLLVFSLFCFFLFDRQQPPVSSLPPIQVDLDISGLKMDYGYDGKKRLTVRAAGGQFVEAEDLVVFREPVILLRDKKDHPVEIQAPHGELKRKQKVVTLTGSIQGHWENTTLEADELTYTLDKDIALFHDTVRIHQPGFLLTCRQVELFPKKRTFQAEGDIQMLFHLNQSAGLRRDQE